VKYKEETMEFVISEREKQIISDVAEFAKQELPAKWPMITMLDGGECRDFDFELSISRKLASKGWLVISWPKECGGHDASVFEQTTYEMELNYWGIPGAWMGVSGIQWVGPCLKSFGTDEQKKTYLPLIASGDRDGYWCTGYSEPNAG
jgi:alkylation response protein AidB-like acyl-CoA dehydrogenase